MADPIKRYITLVSIIVLTLIGLCKSSCNDELDCEACELISSSCVGHSDGCENGKCMCGELSPCSGQNTDSCSAGECFCGSSKQCLGNSDTCLNGKCMCGSSEPCSGNSDKCIEGKCRCGLSEPCSGSSDTCSDDHTLVPTCCVRVVCGEDLCCQAAAAVL